MVFVRFCSPVFRDPHEAEGCGDGDDEEAGDDGLEAPGEAPIVTEHCGGKLTRAAMFLCSFGDVNSVGCTGGKKKKKKNE